MKRLIPYAGAERRPVKQPRNTPTRAAAAPISDPITEYLIGEIRRANGEIRELRDEQRALERILQKIRADRGTTT